MRVCLVLLAALFSHLLPQLCAESLPRVWYGAGGAWNGYAKPRVNGWASLGTLISAKAMLYSFTSWDLTSSRESQFNAQSSVRTGLATVLRQAGPVYILGLGDGGMATAGEAITGAFSGGGTVIIRLGKTEWTLLGGARVLKAGAGNQTIWQFGIGRVQP